MVDINNLPNSFRVMVESRFFFRTSSADGDVDADGVSESESSSHSTTGEKNSVKWRPNSFPTLSLRRVSSTTSTSFASGIFFFAKVLLLPCAKRAYSQIKINWVPSP